MKKFIVYIVAILLLCGIAYSPDVIASDNTTLEEQVSILTNRIVVLESTVKLLQDKFQYIEANSSTAKFSGKGEMNTLPFTITSMPFKLSWSIEASTRSALGIAVYKYPPGTGISYDAVNLIVDGDDSGETYCYMEAGSYYLVVNTKTANSWSIVIE